MDLQKTLAVVLLSCTCAMLAVFASLPTVQALDCPPSPSGPYTSCAHCMACTSASASCSTECAPSVVPHVGSLNLLQPLDDGATTHAITSSATTPGLTFITFFNRGMDIILEVAVGIATLWVLISAGQIILAGGDSSKRAAAFGHIIWTIVGVVMLVFFGLILRVLNSNFFTASLLLPDLLSLGIPTAYAAPGDACALVGGPCTTANAAGAAIGPLISLAISAGAAIAMLTMVWGGFQMLISAGEEGVSTRGKNAIIFAIAGLFIVLIGRTIAAWIIAGFTPLHMHADPLFGVADLAVDAMVALFNVVFIIVTIYAGFRMAFGRGSADEFNKARTMMGWAIAGAVATNTGHAAIGALLTIFGL